MNAEGRVIPIEKKMLVGDRARKRSLRNGHFPEKVT